MQQIPNNSALQHPVAYGSNINCIPVLYPTDLMKFLEFYDFYITIHCNYVQHILIIVQPTSGTFMQLCKSVHFMSTYALSIYSVPTYINAHMYLMMVTWWPKYVVHSDFKNISKSVAQRMMETQLNT
jgi:hypothetical protein